jgi:hypothetical protein
MYIEAPHQSVGIAPLRLALDMEVSPLMVS